MDSMKGVLKGDKVIFGGEAVAELYNAQYYGRLKGETLELALVEAAYLLDRERISVDQEGRSLSFRDFFIAASQAQEYFELKYIVYRDLRERGYYVQPSVTDFRVYPRGGKPNVAPSKYFVHVVTERKPMPLQQLISNLQAALNVRKEMVLAIVDEESDITYYGVKFNVLKGGMEPVQLTPVPGSATFLQDRVVIWDTEVSTRLHQDGFYGNPMDDRRLQLSLVEAAYLIMRGKLEVTDYEGRIMTPDDFTAKALQIESSFVGKLKTYTDLRDKGLVAKTGFKFGSDFRVYEKIETIEKIPHSKYLVGYVENDHVYQMQDLSRSIRLANSVRKDMVFAFDRSGIQYFSLGRIKL
ncbi:tRNA-intron lyase [Methanocella arvoryzae]|uniref:tRNA-splicing endonuclease n=1 Tax=Methanocella arvoryzae (strain DSM 22066 / NBRC 105507 / MRE50) TaxID=351160 RepID=Q0W0Y3_METAR|nr:tRNA-intron lyase [Methanocella arvoryzae]CAJ37960.1 tRNA-splicing endonuclease [Methanocella arvoryzae MRE50]